MSEIKAGKNITEEVLVELAFSSEEEKLFKEILQIINQSKRDGIMDSANEIFEKIEGGIKSDI